MLKKTFHSYLTSALDSAERQTPNPPKELLIPVGKEAYILVGSPEQLAVTGCVRHVMFAPETFGMKAFYNTFLSEAETEKAD